MLVTMHSAFKGDSRDRNGRSNITTVLRQISLWMTYCLLMVDVFLVPASLVVSTVWMLAVVMFLHTKLHLIATRCLV